MQSNDPAARAERLKHAFDNYEPLDEAVIAILRRKTPAERIAMCHLATKRMRLLIAIAIRREPPDWHEPAVQRELARRWLALSDDYSRARLAVALTKGVVILRYSEGSG